MGLDIWGARVRYPTPRQEREKREDAVDEKKKKQTLSLPFHLRRRTPRAWSSKLKAKRNSESRKMCRICDLRGSVLCVGTKEPSLFEGAAVLGGS